MQASYTSFAIWRGCCKTPRPRTAKRYANANSLKRVYFKRLFGLVKSINPEKKGWLRLSFFVIIPWIYEKFCIYFRRAVCAVRVYLWRAGDSLQVVFACCSVVGVPCWCACVRGCVYVRGCSRTRTNEANNDRTTKQLTRSRTNDFFCAWAYCTHQRTTESESITTNNFL